MKERLTAILLFFLALLTLFALTKKLPELRKTYGTIDSTARDAETASASTLSDEVIRLHILADSDSDSDQEIKLLIRDTLLPYLAAVTEVAASKTEALLLLTGQCDTFTAIANQKLLELGVPYTAEVSVTRLYFPIRIYGSQTYLSGDATIFPPGIYDSLQIVLGEGNGHNWWCLAYPSLCFIDSTYDYIPKNSTDYRKTFATIRESSLAKLFYGNDISLSDSDNEVDIYIESKLWNLFTTKRKKFMLH